jgi:dihydrofolate synthase/folylpolyglutamate synthase
MMKNSCMTPIDSIVARLTSLHPKLIDLSLDRMRRILGSLGHPEQQLPPTIHVAGTNGKGSTIRFMRRNSGGGRSARYTSIPRRISCVQRTLSPWRQG